MRFARPLQQLLAPLLLALLALCAQAQQVYRIVGPDGKVTFSDRPPVNQAERAMPVQPAASAGEAGGQLPYALRQVASRFPVTLYTGSNCAPCTTARSLLVQRGIPFTERTVNTREDIDALNKLSGDSGLPFATIGGQKLSGFSDVEWTQYLDAAGYPKESQLPPGYRQPPAAPLVAVQRATPPAAPAPSAAPAAPAVAPSAPQGPAPANPAGITF
ncbi:glutaredoxin family protein [Ramlibacter sp. H39-3-26]|uniref:glutaredoxin family protein n=1 Tax=Curvibacter soli TaxID=3031331 RepID=UPI0023DAD651|nr:glutaredoxin family protein [Ramlibacter sp. H39-3-26]MDF1485242.1 glutaredoxin family protein [Ramlibacter sp. H39-3-26]